MTHAYRFVRRLATCGMAVTLAAPSIRARIDELGARRRSEPKAQSPEPKVASLDQPGNLKGSAGWSSNIAVGISSSIRGA